MTNMEIMLYVLGCTICLFGAKNAITSIIETRKHKANEPK